MRVVLQRVTRASVRVNEQLSGEIRNGIVALVGVRHDDAPNDVAYLIEKVTNLRTFNDDEGRMNKSILDVGGDLLIVSQFTLYGDVRRGRRPSWSEAAAPEVAKALYELFVNEARGIIESYGGRVATGKFGAKMAVELVNDGPVTLLVDSRKLF
ncbi:MAG: D-aminoacyl-tRNA deacylase [Pyrinomonadaceae bacterium MAG19_C2-C3]|nr:D-aminoacyl-tRNA deacylase [Pyrinomonadaceae bacterium MAG19_C2-C3]